MDEIFELILRLLSGFVLRLLLPPDIREPMEEERSCSYYLLLAAVLVLVLFFWFCVSFGFTTLSSRHPADCLPYFGGAAAAALIVLVTRLVLNRVNAPEKGSIPAKPSVWICPDCGTLNLNRNEPCTMCGRKYSG